MTNIFFINDQHQLNYKKMKLSYPQARTSTEYQVPCYIVAIPMIFQKIESVIKEHDSPISWILDWELKYNAPKYDETEEEFQERQNIEINYDLTSSMVQLGRLALNMWNGYENFNLMNCISSVDDENYKVVKCALDMRMGYFKGQ